jgi:hypothetical protein
MLPTIKKIGKYVLIAVLGIGAIVLFIMVWSWWKKKDQADDGQKHVDTLGGVIEEIGAQMNEANQQATVEIEAGRDEEGKIKTELAEIVVMEDKVERRKKLADLYGRVK